MDILETILNNPDLADKIYKKCDIEIYPKMQNPDDNHGQMKWNIDGMAFGCDASGGEFILLSDGTVGFNSSEGETGRIAENISTLFSLLVNCPCFFDFLVDDLYDDKILLEQYSKAMELEYKDSFNQHGEYDWDTVKAEIAEAFGLSVDDNIAENTLKIFYQTAVREPQYQYTFCEENGKESKSECIISRPMRAWIKKKAGL